MAAYHHHIESREHTLDTSLYGLSSMWKPIVSVNEFTSVLVSYVLKRTSVPLNTHLADIFINPVLLH